MMTPICPRLVNLNNDFVLLRFRARAPEDLSAIEVILLLLLFKVIDNANASDMDIIKFTSYNTCSPVLQALHFR